jgi:hypothetical protein
MQWSQYPAQQRNIMNTCPFCNPDKSRLLTANDHAIAIYDGFPKLWVTETLGQASKLLR